MVLLGCLLALGVVFLPRVVLVLAWIFNGDGRWSLVWQGSWFWPLMGIIFMPYTTVMYVLAWQPQGISGWAWMWIGMGVFLDVMKWVQVANNRRMVPGCPQL